MIRLLTSCVAGLLICGCAPKWEDFAKESDRAFLPYLTGDLAAAKGALLEQERIVRKHEAAGNKSVNYRHVRCVVFARLAAVAARAGDTNEMQKYFEASLTNRDSTNAVTLADMLADVERLDREFKPKWRERP